MAKGKRKSGGKKVTRYTYDDIKEPRTPETGHTSLLPAEEQVVTLPMDNGWSKAIEVGKLPEGDERPVVVDMDPAADPVLFWAGKRNRREVPVLPLQRNEIVSESRIAQIIERARRAAEEKSGAARQGHLFADLEKTLRETDREQARRVLHPRGGLEEQAHLRRLAARDGVAAPLREPARQGADDLHRPAVRHQVRLELPAAGGFDEERRERRSRRRADDQGVPGHLGARDPLVPVVPAGAALPVPGAARGDRAAFSFRSATRTSIVSRHFWTRCSEQPTSVARSFSRRPAGQAAPLLSIGVRLSALVREGQRVTSSTASSIMPKTGGDEAHRATRCVELPDGEIGGALTPRRAKTVADPDRDGASSRSTILRRTGETEDDVEPFEFEGTTYSPAGQNSHWKTTRKGMRSVCAKEASIPVGAQRCATSATSTTFRRAA